MKKINYKYRKITKSTDVFSFFYDYSDSVLMGEIFISIKDAEKNCNKNNNTLLDECSILTIHGILHLLGYDHDTKKKEQSMFDIQEKIYKKVI